MTPELEAYLEDPYRRLLVVAGSYTEYKLWCREEGLHPGFHCVYVSRPDKVLGMDRGALYTTVGTWRELHPSILNPIMEAIRSRATYTSLGKTMKY